mgnify:FL=1
MIRRLLRSFQRPSQSPPPKCDICALSATNYMQIEVKSLDLDELSKVLLRLCDGCKDEVLSKYNNNGLPAPIIRWNKDENERQDKKSRT